MKELELKPTPQDCYRIDYPAGEKGFTFEKAWLRSQEQEAAGEIEAACNTRYEAFQKLADLIPEEGETELEWEDEHNQNAMFILNSSAIDHFLIGDFEMCAAMLEMLLELDPEDHLEATKLLAYSYVALGEYELFDEVINDISDKYADKEVLKLWSEFRRNGHLPEGELFHFRHNFAVYYKEFISDAHPVSEEYLQDVESLRPSREALARELWLKTEHLWTLFPGFIEALKA